MGTGYIRKRIENKEINNQLFSLSNSFSLFYLLPSLPLIKTSIYIYGYIIFLATFCFCLLELDKQIDKNILYFLFEINILKYSSILKENREFFLEYLFFNM
jgi:hypothetical protein